MIEQANRMAPILWGHEDRQELYPVTINPKVAMETENKIENQIKSRYLPPQ